MLLIVAVLFESKQSVGSKKAEKVIKSFFISTVELRRIVEEKITKFGSSITNLEQHNITEFKCNAFQHTCCSISIPWSRFLLSTLS